MKQVRSLKRQAGFWNFIIPAIAAIGGAMISRDGVASTNAANAAMTKEGMEWNSQEAVKARDFNSAEAAKARDWQERQVHGAQEYATNMANTTYQRAVGDMRAAGLNPMLAYSQGGAPSPTVPPGSAASASGPSASYSSYARQENPNAKLAESLGTALQLANVAKQNENIDADTKLKEAQAARETNSAENIKYQSEKLVTAEIPFVREQIRNIQADTVNKDAQKVLTEAQTLLSKTQQMVEAGKLDLQEADVAIKKVEALLKQLQVPEAKAYADKFSGDYGSTVTPYMREILDVLRVLIYSRSGWRP